MKVFLGSSDIQSIVLPIFPNQDFIYFTISKTVPQAFVALGVNVQFHKDIILAYCWSPISLLFVKQFNNSGFLRAEGEMLATDID